MFLDRGVCDYPNSADKGVEVAVRTSEGDGRWIPVAYYHRSFTRRFRIFIGDFELKDPPTVSVNLRGHKVTATEIDESRAVSFELCDPALFEHGPVQIRWLQTSRHPKTSSPPVDVWTLDNVTIDYVSGDSVSTLLHDTFNSSTLK